MTRMVVIVGFVASFAAGLVVGTRWHRAERAVITQPDGGPGWVSSELGLTPAQQEQMKQIWSEAADAGGRVRDERHRELARQRDQAIAALLGPENKPKYEQVLRDYAEKTAALEREGRAAFKSAVEQTKQILTPEQRTRYEEILTRHESRRGPHRGDRERGPGRRPEHRGASRPASRP